MPTALVFDNNQAAVDAIRAAGAKYLVLVPGAQWSGGHSWAENWGGFIHLINDPENNYILDIHELSVSTRTPENLAELTAWLKGHKLKAMITEFGGSPTTSCENMLREALQYMEDSEEYIGWTAWATGPFWGPNSPRCTDQRQLGSLESGSKAVDGGPNLYERLWLKGFQPMIPATLQ